jgi:SAM-dependent methyltransferase
MKAALLGQPPIPRPRSMLGGGRGDFVRTGKHLQRVLQEVARLRPDERILDVGCGPGRVARLLTDYLSDRGSYEGFDVMAENIDWCRRTIATRRSRFRFVHVNLFNEMYNPQGDIQPSMFMFPYPESEFDLVFAFSVFTHMLPSDVRQYLLEVHRVLKPGARCLMTFFLLSERSESAIRSGRAARVFATQGHGYRSDSARIHERAVAYKEEWLRNMLGSSGLSVAEPIHYGRWSGSDGPLDQDVVLAVRDQHGPAMSGGQESV